jgi:hypothetical protein
MTKKEYWSDAWRMLLLFACFAFCVALPVYACVYTSNREPTPSFEEILREKQTTDEREADYERQTPGFHERRARLKKLAGELEDAKASGDSKRAAAVQAAIDQLERENYEKESMKVRPEDTVKF